MKIFITKYGLTQGILEEEADASANDIFQVRKPGYLHAYYHKGMYELTLADAEAKVKQMAIKAKTSLLKKIAKLEKKFGI